MNDQFKHYIDQIPDKIYSNTKVYASEHISLMMPNGYISDISITSEDYHITIPNEIPPPIMIGRKEYNISRNKMIIFNPEINVYCKKNEAITRRYSTITIKKNFMSEVAQNMGFDKKITFSNIENPSSNNIKQAILAYKQEIESYGISSSMMIDSFSTQIVATILREMKNNFNSRYFCVTVGDGYVKNAQDYIREYYNSDISIKDICNEIHITPYHFIRLFREKTGMTPHEYLLNHRIENAKKMIKNNDDSIMLIGKKCGFVNNAHFSTTFKRLTGVSPIEYKRTM